MDAGALPEGRFTRKKEDVVCDICGVEIHGTGYTDHCPNCLASKHVDIMPGDRKNGCRGVMKPTRTVYERGEYSIEYVCEACGERKRVKAAADDDRGLLYRLASGAVAA